MYKRRSYLVLFVRWRSSQNFGLRGARNAVAPRVCEDAMADALKEAASKKLEGFSQDVKVRLLP